MADSSKLGFMRAHSVAVEGFKAWAAKPHNAKWFKRIDGTPIPNDLVVWRQTRESEKARSI